MTRSILSLAMVATLAGPIGAQEPVLHLGDAVKRALTTHPAIAASEAATGSARAAVRQARASWFPNASLEATATRFGDPMVVAPLHGFDLLSPPTFDRALWQAGLAVSWSLFDPARRDRIGVAREQVPLAEARDEAVKESLTGRTIAAYLEVTTARDLVTFHDARLNALRHEQDRARAFVREGRNARLAEVRANAALAAAEADRLSALARRDAAERTLERLLALPGGSLEGRALDSVRLAPADTVMDRAGVIAAAEARNPELDQLAARVEAARAARAEAHASWYPRLNLVGRLVQYGSAQGSASAEWQGGVALSYPLFTGGARPAAVDRAGAELAAARADADAARRNVGDAVDRALAGFRAAKGRVAALGAAAAQAAEVARIERLALEQGAGVQTDYLTAEADLLRGRANLADAWAALINARVELARLAGDLSSEWLAAHLES